MSTACSPLPPDMAPVRRSETSGLGASTHFTSGSTRRTKTSPASTSATACTTEPASAAGLVAPAWPAEISITGMPSLTPSSKAAQASSAKRRGGTTWHDSRVQNGRRRNRPSPPAAWSNMATTSRTCSGWAKLVPSGLAVPARMA